MNHIWTTFSMRNKFCSADWYHTTFNMNEIENHQYSM
jgi:hypothetical protein